MRDLSKQILEDPETINDLTIEEASELRKHMNPLGNILTSEKCFVNMSVLNFSDEYQRKFVMTTMIGYLFRLVSEYEPEEIVERHREQTERIITQVRDIFDTPPAGTAKASGGASEKEKLIEALCAEHSLLSATSNELVEELRLRHADYKKKATKSAQGVIQQFLNRHFNFNPDTHLRGSHSTSEEDPERPSDRREEIMRKCKIAEAAPAVEEKLRSRPDAMYSYMRQNLLRAYQDTVQSAKLVKDSLTTMMDPVLDIGDKQGILLKKYRDMMNRVADMKKVVEPLSTADTLASWKVNPPVDVFHQIQRYMTNHYEQLRECQHAFYNEKPDLEFGVIVYKSFGDEESARRHRNQHGSEFRSEVVTVENSGITLLGPFKENRNRVAFYEKNIEVMKRMMEQMELDHKLGQDLMKKQVKKKKRENIQRDGPDAKGLHDYSKSMNTVRDLGAKKGLTKEDEEKLQEAQTQIDDFNTPDEAIQIDMFFPQEVDGETRLGKKKFYTQAEAPLHLQENSEYHEEYQPVRDGTMSDAYTTKTITSSKGEKRTITVVDTANSSNMAPGTSNGNSGTVSGKGKEEAE